MKFTILRLLTHSELGMFHEYRRSGREGSKQRAINFDSDVVDRVFPAAKDSDRIEISCRCFEDAQTLVVKDQWLKKQEKNWRLEGNCPQSPYYSFVEPGVLFVMVVDSSTSPALASWMVIPTEHPARTAIINHGESARLSTSSMIALHGDEGEFCRKVIEEHFPQMFEKADIMQTLPTSGTGMEPDPVGLFKILARAGHSLPSAVADLVDNSLSKGASEIDITFPNPNQGGRWMCIRDNGYGMTPEGLRDAMKIGHQRDYDAADLGKYGYGLKGAAWSQADRLTVVSRSAAGPESVLTWDKEHLERTRRWDIIEAPVEEKYTAVVRLGASGTAVLLTRMRPPIEAPKVKGVDPYSQELASVRDHLELVFHRFLEGAVRGRQRVIIRLNGKALQPNNPMAHPLTKPFDHHSIELPGQQEPSTRPIIMVRAHVLPTEAEFNEYHKSLTPEALREARERLTLNGRWNESQGFYFYRLDRLIKWGGWEGLFTKDEHTKLLRVAVDFDRRSDEQLQVDISKQLIRLPVALTDSLMEVLRTPRSHARNRYAKKVSQGSGGGSTPPAGTGSGTGDDVTGKKGTKGPGRTPTVPPQPTKKERSPLRLVEGSAASWVRKTGFTGEHVEISQRIPGLFALAQAISEDIEAQKALSEFLRVLEDVGVVRILDGKPDGQ
ncbi:ATPase [Myxococcus stipitatus DSM 14675]|uniref:ATPase n=1 Tax=Myxococcus stipitatus (strain DSM 14675 / JCM 12634 / Mx s8) TaxID=1278073 RepID=L7UCN7_MYXSD|nr:ATP-binding protein [Myxococcus stipitatus]AGC45635.1 ATPase [Myxococcus stipitatus DSM 14675]